MQREKPPREKQMSDPWPYPTQLPPGQQAIRDKCFHPSGTFVEFPKEEIEQSIPERFERIVSKYPDRIAIKSGEKTLSYTQLNCQANRLAHSIVGRQGDKAEPIAILLETGATLMAATVGVLKAGKFVVLLDPSFPESLNAAILKDSQAKVVISNRHNAPLLSKMANRDCRFMEIEPATSGISADNLRLSVAPNALAFLVYTSGSTGEPKGVMQDHRSRLHQFMWGTNTYHICEHDRSSLLSSGTSSAMVVSLWTLLNGAMLLPFDVRREGVNRLASWLLRERISVCVISSPLFRNLCETLTGKEEFPDLRLMRLGSETAYKTDFDLYKKHFLPNCLLANGLSLSETGALADYLMDQETEISGNEIPVGYPLEDIEISLLNDENKEVGFNRVGEIVVRSRYLSPGYWRRPDLTEAKFKSDPEGGDKRFYLTGDLGLMLPDGCLVHRGRKDFRVKIRGYGVEIAEAENVLRDYAAIDDAVVVARENESGEARLVAYFTSPNQPGPSVSELRRFLKNRLPDYMIPSAFMMLDAIPLTPNGKIDRGALPDPKNSRPDLNTLLVAPRTSNEEKLVKIWAEKLRVDQIGVHDNFFDLGGHSLLAMRVIAQIRDDLQVELSLSHLFETPTVAALAGYIETAQPPRDAAEAFSIQPASRDGQLRLSFAQECLWFIDQLEPGSTAYNLFSAVQLTGPLNIMALEQSLNEIIKRHEALRTVFKSVNGQPFQIILPTLTIAIPLVDLRDITSPTEREAEIRRLAATEAQRPFDLAGGPLLRATLLRSTEETYFLLLIVHHIIFDGWSRGVLYQELSVIYEAFSSERPASLPALPIQYADFAQWQRQWLRGKVLEEQLAYWKKQLENLPILQFPSDRPRPAVQTFRGARQSFTLPEYLFEGLKILGRQEGITVFMTLLTAYLTLLHRYTGQNDIGIGAPISTRERSELEGLIGLFLNILVLRTDLSGNPTFRELLSRVRKVCLEAYANQEVPFERVVQESRPERSLSHNPLFQVTFALQNTPTCPLKLAGVTTQDLELGSGIASFDLHLFMIEHETTLCGWLVYNTDLFDASSIARLVSHFQILLEGIVANPDERICDLPILTASPTVAEMATVITEFHGKNLGEKDLDRILTELESLSDEEAKRLLADQSETATTKN
jgi:amino acid adenylation domain-containing protein